MVGRAEFRHIKINIEFVSWKRSADTMIQRYQHCSRLVVKALVAALRCAVTKFRYKESFSTIKNTYPKYEYTNTCKTGMINMWCFSEQVRVPNFGTKKNGVRNNEEKHGTIKIMDEDP